jgi:hypothetical protein
LPAGQAQLHETSNVAAAFVSFCTPTPTVRNGSPPS